jgi:hypothetical protein
MIGGNLSFFVDHPKHFREEYQLFLVRGPTITYQQQPTSDILAHKNNTTEPTTTTKSNNHY